jgi:hypothetical protein
MLHKTGNSAPPLTRFPLGRIVATRGALDLCLDLLPYLRRHVTGDWGNLDEEDMVENEFSVANGFRILSAYETPSGKLWIITEADRSATTVLLPEEY